MEMDYKQFFCNPHMACVESAKLKFLARLITEFENTAIQKILEYDKPGELSCFDDDGYCEVCATLWNVFSGYDTGCSSGQHDLYRFASDMVWQLSEIKKETMLKIKKEKLTKLKTEVAVLELEIAPSEAQDE